MSESFVTPCTLARQPPLSMGFPMQKCCSHLPFPSPRYLPDPEIEPLSPALAVGFYTTEPPGKSMARTVGMPKSLQCRGRLWPIQHSLFQNVKRNYDKLTIHYHSKAKLIAYGNQRNADNSQKFKRSPLYT